MDLEGAALSVQVIQTLSQEGEAGVPQVLPEPGQVSQPPCSPEAGPAQAVPAQACV